MAKKSKNTKKSDQSSNIDYQELMKKISPFILPGIALLIVIALALRWYRMKTPSDGEITDEAQDIEIESLSDTDTKDILKGTGDYKTVDLKGDKYMGEVRYELKDGKVKFTVNASLEDIMDGVYQVWLKDSSSDAIRKAFVMELNKGGYVGSAAISEEALPFEVIVSQDSSENVDSPEDILLRGTITE